MTSKLLTYNNSDLPKGRSILNCIGLVDLLLRGIRIVYRTVLSYKPNLHPNLVFFNRILPILLWRSITSLNHFSLEFPWDITHVGFLSSTVLFFSIIHCSDSTSAGYFFIIMIINNIYAVILQFKILRNKIIFYLKFYCVKSL